MCFVALTWSHHTDYELVLVHSAALVESLVNTHSFKQVMTVCYSYTKFRNHTALKICPHGWCVRLNQCHNCLSVSPYQPEPLHYQIKNRLTLNSAHWRSCLDEPACGFYNCVASGEKVPGQRLHINPAIYQVSGMWLMEEVINESDILFKGSSLSLVNFHESQKSGP